MTVPLPVGWHGLMQHVEQVEPAGFVRSFDARSLNMPGDRNRTTAQDATSGEDHKPIGHSGRIKHQHELLVALVPTRDDPGEQRRKTFPDSHLLSLLATFRLR